MKVASLISMVAVLTFSNYAFAALNPRYGLQCVVKTVQVDEKDFVQALLQCKSDLVNVKTRSAIKTDFLVAAKQSGMPLVLDVAGSAEGTIVDIQSIYMP